MGRLLGRFLLLAFVLGVALSVVAVVKAASTPDLGSPPGGDDHGDDQASIAAYVVRTIAPLLLPGHDHQTVALSERDVTVIVRANAPRDGSLSDPQARLRDGRLVVDGHTDIGPVRVAGVGRLRLSVVTGSDGLPDVAAQIEEVDVGTLTLPVMLRRAVADRVTAAARLGGLLGASPEVGTLRPLLECARVTADAVVLGFHAPGIGADPGACG